MREVSRVNNYEELKKNNISKEKYFYKDKYIIKLLTLYMVNNDNKSATELLNDIINKKCELNENPYNSELVNLLYIAELLNLTENLLRSYPKYNLFEKSEMEDLKIFSIYRDFRYKKLNNPTYVLKKIKLKNFKLLDSDLRLKVNTEFSNRIKGVNPEEKAPKLEEYYLI
jgi:hypothetical protein